MGEPDGRIITSHASLFLGLWFLFLSAASGAPPLVAPSATVPPRNYLLTFQLTYQGVPLTAWAILPSYYGHYFGNPQHPAYAPTDDFFKLLHATESRQGEVQDYVHVVLNRLDQFVPEFFEKTTELKGDEAKQMRGVLSKDESAALGRSAIVFLTRRIDRSQFKDREDAMRQLNHLEPLMMFRMDSRTPAQPKLGAELWLEGKGLSGPLPDLRIPAKGAAEVRDKGLPPQIEVRKMPDYQLVRRAFSFIYRIYRRGLGMREVYTGGKMLEAKNFIENSQIPNLDLVGLGQSFAGAMKIFTVTGETVPGLQVNGRPVGIIADGSWFAFDAGDRDWRLNLYRKRGVEIREGPIDNPYLKGRKIYIGYLSSDTVSRIWLPTYAARVEAKPSAPDSPALNVPLRFDPFLFEPDSCGTMLGELTNQGETSALRMLSPGLDGSTRQWDP